MLLATQAKTRLSSLQQFGTPWSSRNLLVHHTRGTAASAFGLFPGGSRRSGTALDPLQSRAMVDVPEIRVSDEAEEDSSPPKICPHLKKACRFRRIEPKIRDLKDPKSRICKTCTKSSDRGEVLSESAQLWLCLGCGGLFCGRYDKGHAAKHYEKAGESDCLMWNMESFACWCYLCDDNVRSAPNRNESLVQVEKYWLKHAEGGGPVQDPEPTVSHGKALSYQVITPGFQNLGNTCFFNSVIQLLASIEQLHEIVSPQPLVERSSLEIQSTSDLTMAFTKVLNEVYATEKEKTIIKPHHLFGEIHRKFPRFTKGAQQDAQELLHYLLEGLKADEVFETSGGRPDMKRTRSRRRTTGEEEFEMTERVPSKVEKKDEWRPSNYIESIFEGRLASIVICSTCKSISTTYDQFEELSLSIVQEKQQIKERKGRFRAAFEDISRKSRNSLSLTRGPNTRRGTPMSRSGSKNDSDLELPSLPLSPKTSRPMPGPDANQTSMSEAVSEEEAEDAVAVEAQLKAHTFSMSEAKNRLLSFASSRKTQGGSSSLDEALSPTSTPGSYLSEVVPLPIPAPSFERTQYIERLLQEPDVHDQRGGIEDSLRDFTTVECLENENAFACEECAKLMAQSGDQRNSVTSMAGIEREDSPMTKKASRSNSSVMDVDREAAVDPRSSPKSEPPTPTAPKHILRKAYKRFLVADLPNILILHLKRFQQSGKSIYSSLRKNDAVVSFDEHLDMSPYLMPKSASGQAAEVGRTRYRCIGAIVHIGTINSGHYVAYFLSHKVSGSGESLRNEAGSVERQWVFASDAMTRPCSWAEVSKSRAYMIFYERV